jgi:hypothetical protein
MIAFQASSRASRSGNSNKEKTNVSSG